MNDPLNTYDFTEKKRGIALLIHNEFFLPSSYFPDRPGDDKDYKHMKKLFKGLGFKVCSFRNKTKSEILQIVEDFADLEFHEESDCFVCVVASHGNEEQTNTDVHSTELSREHVIVGVDGNAIKTSKLVEMFDNDHCEALQGKPKFFFIQACRISKYKDKSEGMDKGTSVLVVGNEEIKKNKGKGKQMVDASNQDDLDLEDSFERNNGSEAADKSYVECPDLDDELTSDTDDDEEFLPFKAKLQGTAISCKSQNPTSTDKQARRNKTDELDSKRMREGPEKLLTNTNKNDNQLNVTRTTKPHKQVSTTKTSDSKSVPMVTIVPCPEDTLIMFASLSGNYAVRSQKTGGWLLNKLYDCFKEYTEEDAIDFLEVLTKILGCMSFKTYDPSTDSKTRHLEGQFSPGCFTHCLSKNVYFTKKNSKRKKFKLRSLLCMTAC